jgi:integrase
MARPATGTTTTETAGDGTLCFRLRFRAHGKRQTVRLHERRDCDCGCGGGWNERTAAVELDQLLARVKAGVWTAPHRQTVGAPADPGVPTFLAYSSRWSQARTDGVLGSKPLTKNTESYYRWLIESHLLPFFADYRLDQIDRELCLAFKAHKLRQAKELREAIEAGAELRNRHGQRIVPLSPGSIRKCIDALAAILEDAVEDGHIEHNHARGKRMRVHVPKPKRTFLEIDELAALIDAAAEQDVSLSQIPARGELGLTAAMVAQLFAQGKPPVKIAKQLRLAKSTVSYHLRRLGLTPGRGYVGRRVVVEILGRGGPRASELCDMKIGHVRVHDPDGARFHIPDSKTETGIREVQMSPDLVEAIVEHIDRLRRIGAPTGPDDYLVPSAHGTRMSYERVEKIVRDAAARASQQLIDKGLPPLPNTTPHTLRRTYISVALLANNFDVKWVMSQVGHADSKMTLDVYAQLEQRVDRSHGTSFDALIRGARGQAHAPGDQQAEASGNESARIDRHRFGTGNGTKQTKSSKRTRVRRPSERPKSGACADNSSMELGGLEPPTSWVRSRRSPS